MSKHDPLVAIEQILSYAREAVSITADKSREDLDTNRVLNLALARLVEMIGEAAKRVPDRMQDKYPSIPWLQMIGARNRLIHGYDSVDFDILWAIVTRDLPILIRQLQEILESEH